MGRSQNIDLQRLLKKKTPSQSTKEAVPFDELFEQLLLDLYTHWYDYPLKSTRQRFLTVIAPPFADALLNSQDSDELKVHVLQFVESLKGLPRLEDVIENHLRQIEARLGSGTQSQSSLVRAAPAAPISISDEKRALILAALQATHPVQWLLMQMESTSARATCHQ